MTAPSSSSGTCYPGCCPTGAPRTAARRRPARWAAPLALLAVVAVGCGGAAEQAEPTGGSPTPTTAPPTQAAAPSPTPSPPSVIPDSAARPDAEGLAVRPSPSPEPSPAPDPAAPVAASPAPAPASPEPTEPSPDPTATSPGSDGGQPEQVAVTIRDFTFMPGEVRVPSGSTVTWTNADGPAHTVTLRDGSSDSILQTDETAQITFDEPGTYAYFCRFHGNMTGTIVVAG